MLANILKLFIYANMLLHYSKPHQHVGQHLLARFAVGFRAFGIVEIDSSARMDYSGASMDNIDASSNQQLKANK